MEIAATILPKNSLKLNFLLKHVLKINVAKDYDQFFNFSIIIKGAILSHLAMQPQKVPLL